MGFYDNLPGYKNPSWSGNSDWKGAGEGIDWKGGFGVDKSGLWDKSFGRYNNPAESYLNLTKDKLLNKAKKDREDRDYGSRGSSGG